MNRFTAITTAAIAAGTLLFAPAAHADPTFSITANGTTVGDGIVLGTGTTITHPATGCLDGQGNPGYVGEFLTWLDAPDAPTSQSELPTEADGSFRLEITMEDLQQPMHLNVAFYCSSAPITSPSDAAILYLTPTYDVTVDPTQSGSHMARSTAVATSPAPKAQRHGFFATMGRQAPARAAAGSSTIDVGTMTVDPDALPPVDRLGITREPAAALKAKVDARYRIQQRVDGLVRKVLGRPAATAAEQDRAYVDAAFDVVGGRPPAKATVDAFAARLDAGALRVSVVEDIALTKAPASHWNRLG
ncbi:MAG: hypothetical protein U0P45_10875 [Acidimicrobiales bacterium]